ncbi:hypothetical protein D9M71_426360 [compost metagenome]
MALYQAGDYAEAAARFAQGDSAADHYNRGNALARAGELEAAIDAYESTLERQPDLAAAQKNKALVEALLRQREAQAGDQARQADDQQQAGQSGEQDAARQQGASQSAAQQGTGDAQRSTPTQPGTGGSAEDALDPDATQPRTASAEPLGDERRQALEQWLRQIPDDPAELLRRKFWYEQQQRQEEQ